MISSIIKKYKFFIIFLILSILISHFLIKKNILNLLQINQSANKFSGDGTSYRNINHANNELKKSLNRMGLCDHNGAIYKHVDFLDDKTKLKLQILINSIREEIISHYANNHSQVGVDLSFSRCLNIHDQEILQKKFKSALFSLDLKGIDLESLYKSINLSHSALLSFGKYDWIIKCKGNQIEGKYIDPYSGKTAGGFYKTKEDFETNFFVITK